MSQEQYEKVLECADCAIHTVVKKDGAMDGVLERVRDRGGGDRITNGAHPFVINGKRRCITPLTHDMCCDQRCLVVLQGK